MAAFAARTFLRCSSLHSAARAVRVTSSEARISRPSLCLPKLRPPPRILRSPAVLSICVDSFLPMHNATAAALMTSMLSVSMNGYGWLSKVGWMILSHFISSSHRLDPFPMDDTGLLVEGTASGE